MKTAFVGTSAQVYRDNCPISTVGLRMLLALVEHAEAEGSAETSRTDMSRTTIEAVIRVQREQQLISERFEAAFGRPVSCSEVRSLEVMG